MANAIETYFEIKDGIDFIKIQVLKQNYPDGDLDWDRNSLNCNVSVKCGAFSGRFNADLMSWDFDIFKTELEYLYNNLNRTAIFEGIESQVRIVVQGDGIGHLKTRCQIMDYAGTGNELNCELNFDQTELPQIIGQLEKITKEYKVYGRINEKSTGANKELS
ncbi:hypothetical protein GZ212_15880 [Mangrovimonas sp. CR14]|uniref:WapI family immunity protein n=1 Tax=Mangrovimonas sp. CR14 TaxID=2706120 RepID=UPI0014212A26|nr:hypothetical protein [Mangrovimonas sp. CR14]NIK93640.1 hypothetical protein [Mangrovimonas sp. CR14]